jgi:TolA-binding protein
VSTNGVAVVHGQSVGFEVEAPHLALDVGCTVDVYVQTDTGREQAKLLGGSLDAKGGENMGAIPPFDITVPGTLHLRGKLIHHPYNRDPRPPVSPIAIYTAGETLRSDGGSLDTVSRNIFSCRIPLIAEFLPSYGVLSDQEIKMQQKKGLYLPQGGLVVRTGEKIHVGYRYKDASGAERWITGSAKVISHPVLDIMEAETQEEKSKAFIGETLKVRVVDLGADVSDLSDIVKVTIQSKSGAKFPVELLEVDKHSGVFKGTVELSYLKGLSGSTNDLSFSVERNGFPVNYGDRVVFSYMDVLAQKAAPKLVLVNNGANGSISLFSKNYTDPDIGVRTQFSMAESYLEMAKRHRTLGEEKTAAKEYAMAKEMLEKSMDVFRDQASRAQAEYLLANLTQEEADATKGDPELREARYRAALARYLRVTGNYSDAPYAAKAQFKIATIYEQLNQYDVAAEEYVKLAYSYSDSELLGVAMARLGKYFKQKAGVYEEKAKALLVNKDDKNAQFEGKAMAQMAVREYLKSADIFYRLLERFPDHELAGVGGLMAGQSLMRAGDNQKALKVFKQVYEHDAYDGPKLRAEAMYWAGMSSENLSDRMGAYAIFKRLTYDFPETKWASYARGRLSEEGMLKAGKAADAK